MKKSLYVILITLILIMSISLGASVADATVTNAPEEIETEEEYIYYSDLFYGYSSYLTNNVYFRKQAADTLGVFENILNEYITTRHFITSAAIHGVNTTLDIKSLSQKISDEMGLSSFAYNEELDNANKQFIDAVFEINLSANKQVKSDNKCIKNVNAFLNIVSDETKNALEKEAFLKNLEKAELYEYFFDSWFSYYESYFTEIEPKLPSIKSQLYTAVNETTEILGTLEFALDFMESVTFYLAIQDLELGLIQDIIDTQDSSSDLYKGMVRLKNQIDGGLIVYLCDEFLADKGYSIICGYAESLIELGIAGISNNIGGVVSVVTTAVSTINDLVFIKWLGYDYSEYTSALMINNYANDLKRSIENKASIFSSQFDNNEIKKFETLYNAYIAVNKAAFEECKNLAEHNTQYNLETYVPGVESFFYIDDAYNKYIDEVKAFIKAIPKENRTITEYGEWIIKGYTIIQEASDNIEDNVIYAVNKQITQKIYSESYDILIKDSLSISKISTRNCLYASNKDIYVYIDELYYITPKSSYVEYNIYFDSINITVNSLKISSYMGTTTNIYLCNSAITINNTFNMGSKRYLYIDEGSVLKTNDFFVQAHGGEYHSKIIVNDGQLKCNNLYLNKAPQSSVLYGSEAQSYLTLNEDSSLVEIMGDLMVDGVTDMRVTKGNVSINKGTLYVHGDVVFSSRYNYTVSYGKMYLCGENVQMIENVPIYNVDITNSQGILLNSDMEIFGSLNTNNNPISQNGYNIRLKNNSQISGEPILESVVVDESCSIAFNFKCTTLLINNLYSSDTCLTILKGNCIIVENDINMSYLTKLKNYGELIVGGSILLNPTDSYGWLYSSETSFYNYNSTTVKNDIIGKNYGCIYMDNNAILSIGGDINLVSNSYSKVSSGSTILNGNKKQSITNFSSPTFIIENISNDGVFFNSNIFPYVLFDHQGNNFTLYNNGSSSTFVDYDGDGMKDNVDPEPTVGNPCTLYFMSEDIEKGTVSLSEVETIGGTKINVVATPTFKYDFSKWIDLSGATVSTSASCTLVARGDETYTAVFTKRQQPITPQADGGIINAPTSAEIESTVNVSVTENDGYVYTEDSLSYNGIIVENGSFIMPDEAVTLTAEFIRNENYFNLQEVLTVAKGYTYQSYSAESFAVLTTAINNAETALVNNITSEDSTNHIIILQNAIDGLTEKYIVSVALKTVPTLYFNVPEMINNISVLVAYDNGTTITVTGADCTIGNYNSAVLGQQEITLTYGGVVGNVTVTVSKRLLTECTVSNINDVIFDGVKAEYTQNPILTYDRTGEIMVLGEDYTLVYSNNTEIGEANVLISGIGNYEDSQLHYYNIYCEHIFEEIDRIDSTCTQFGSATGKCTICDIIRSYENVVTEGLPESDHNYSNNCNKSYYYTAEGASSLVLVFSSETLLENTYDKIYIYDGTDTLLNTYTGSGLAGKTVTVSGDTVRIRLTSDGSVVKYGFSLDSITSYYDALLIQKKDHSYGEWEIEAEATPGTAGTKVKKCSMCGDEVKESFEYVSPDKVLEDLLNSIGFEIIVTQNIGTVVVGNPSIDGKAITVEELTELINNENVTITSTNGVIGTGSKISVDGQALTIVVKGDIDGDGIATVFDALMVKKALAENSFIENDIREFAGDIDGTGVTDSADVDAILSHIVGEALIA